MRNFLIRTASGILFFGAILLALFIDPLIFAALFSIFIGLMMWEYFRLSIPDSYKTGKILSLITGLSIFLLVFFHQYRGLDLKYLYLIVLPILLIFISLLYKKPKESYELHPWLISAIVYIALPITMYNVIIFDTDGLFNGRLLFGLFILQWTYDVGAYIFGTLFGQKNGHRLFPSISPKKSWEGVAGGLLTTLAVVIILFYTGLSPISLTHSLIIALIVSIFATFGDLCESQIKRNFGVKDSGKIMPGHGGILDRLDGAIMAIPAAIVYIKVFGLL